VPNFMAELRREIRRLARKETKQEVGSLRKQVTAMRRRVAESNRQIRDLEARLRVASRQAVGRGRSAMTLDHGDEEEDGKQVRFSPRWVKKHRKKLQMSRRVYAQLLDVSPQTIMGWESGRTRPRRGALRKWREMRAKGIRELRSLLDGVQANGASPARRKRRRKKAVRRGAARGAARTARRATRRAARGATRRVVRRRKRAAASARPRTRARRRARAAASARPRTRARRRARAAARSRR